VKKIGLICLTLVLALGGLGVGYALWSDTAFLDVSVQTGNVEWEYLRPPAEAGGEPRPPIVTHDDDYNPDQGKFGFDPPDYLKNVASTDWVYIDSDGDGDFDTLQITIANAYPGYTNHLAFWVHGKGSVPLHIEKVHFLVDGVVVRTMIANGAIGFDLGDGAIEGDDIYVTWGDSFGTQLHDCDFADMSFDISILQPAPQGATMSFQVQLEAVQYNESIHP